MPREQKAPDDDSFGSQNPYMASLCCAPQKAGRKGRRRKATDRDSAGANTQRRNTQLVLVVLLQPLLPTQYIGKEQKAGKNQQRAAAGLVK